MTDFGTALAHWMQARGMGVRELHRRSGYSAGYVSQLRQGHRRPSPQAARDLDDALGAQGELAKTAPIRQPLGVTAGRPVRESRPGVDAITCDRASRQPGDQRSAAVVAAIGAALHASPEPGPARSRSAVQRDLARAWRLRQSAEYAQLGDLLVGLLQDTASDAQEAALPVHVHNMVSSFLKRLGAFEMAAIAADRAYLAARHAGCGLLVGAARLRVANVYLAASCHAEAVAVAAAAADDLPLRHASPPEETATHGALLLTAAVAAAKLGEAAQAWEFLGRARAATAASDREHVGLHALFGPANLAVHGVQVATELGDGREALRRAGHAAPARLPAALLERRATLLIDIGRAQHQQRHYADAASTLAEAERVAPLEVRYSGAARGLLGSLLTTGQATGSLRELVGRMSAAA
jgi:transcriptional regulator with XRE-family HTH domain